MSFSRNKTKTTFASILILLMMSVMLMTVFSIANAQTIQLTTHPHAFLSCNPNPIGVGQTVLVNFWLTPSDPRGSYLHGYTVTITKPDGTKDVIGPMTDLGQGDASNWFTYVPDRVGEYKLQFTFAGDTINDSYTRPGQTLLNYFEPASSPVTNLTVQQDLVPMFQDTPLPTDAWTYPIFSENRLWSQISGAWYMSAYNASSARFNPYSQAPSSAHILWRIAPMSGLGGLIGGETGNGKYYASSSYSIACAMDGLAFSTSKSGYIVAFNMTNGAKVWEVPATFTGAAVPNAPTVNIIAEQNSSTPYLVSLSSGYLLKWNALTGNLDVNVSLPTGITSGTWDDPYYYSIQTQNATAGRYRLIKWNTLGTSTNFTSRIIYNTSYPYSSFGSLVPTNQGMFAISAPIPGATGIFRGTNMTSGVLAWNRTISDDEAGFGTSCSAFGYRYIAMMLNPDPNAGRVYNCYDPTTGQMVWQSDPGYYPWGDFWGYQTGAAYGLVYALSYNPSLYAFNASTGHIAWTYTDPAPTETPYGAYSVWNGPVIADNKIYVGTTEHTPTQPYYRGQGLICVNALNGSEIWQMRGIYNPTAIAQGCLFATDSYTGYSDCFGRGPTQTTVSITDNAIAKGDYTWITGTITDQSPAQSGTPCVSLESMPAWMAYLYCQQPKPTNTTGVSIQLTAVHSDGTIINIGQTMSDAQGSFNYKWSPPDEDYYTIFATFLGDESYYASRSLTTLSVSAAPIVPEPQPQVVIPDYTMTIIAATAAIIIAVVVSIAIVGAIIIRKRP